MRDKVGGDGRGLIGAERYLASMFRVSLDTQRLWGMSVEVDNQLKGWFCSLVKI